MLLYRPMPLPFFFSLPVWLAVSQLSVSFFFGLAEAAYKEKKNKRTDIVQREFIAVHCP